MGGSNNFLTGNRVYGSGSFAPTRGQVSAQGAQGYIQRSLRQANTNGREGMAVGASRIGNDGMSDTRSGVAAMAMQRGGQTPPTKPPIKGGGNPRHHNPGQSTPPTKPPRKPLGGGGQPPGSVGITHHGLVKLPYDDAFNAQTLANMQQLNSGLSQLQSQRQDYLSQFVQGRRQENEGYRQDLQTNLASDAGAGMAFSTKYATDRSNLQNQHQNTLDQMITDRRGYIGQLGAQRAALRDTYNQQQAAALWQRGNMTAYGAGTLGYGQNGRRRGKRGIG